MSLISNIVSVVYFIYQTIKKFVYFTVVRHVCIGLCVHVWYYIYCGFTQIIDGVE